MKKKAVLSTALVALLIFMSFDVRVKQCNRDLGFKPLLCKCKYGKHQFMSIWNLDVMTPLFFFFFLLKGAPQLKIFSSFYISPLADQRNSWRISSQLYLDSLKYVKSLLVSQALGSFFQGYNSIIHVESIKWLLPEIVQPLVMKKRMTTNVEYKYTIRGRGAQKC